MYYTVINWDRKVCLLTNVFIEVYNGWCLVSTKFHLVFVMVYGKYHEYKKLRSILKT